MLTDYKKNLANNKEVYLRVKVLTGAGATAWLEEMADKTLKIALKARPEKGRANEELIKFLAKEFKVDKKGIRILSGLSERLKLIKISL